MKDFTQQVQQYGTFSCYTHGAHKSARVPCMGDPHHNCTFHLIPPVRSVVYRIPPLPDTHEGRRWHYNQLKRLNNTRSISE